MNLTWHCLRYKKVPNNFIKTSQLAAKRIVCGAALSSPPSGVLPREFLCVCHPLNTLLPCSLRLFLNSFPCLCASRFPFAIPHFSFFPEDCYTHLLSALCIVVHLFCFLPYFFVLSFAFQLSINHVALGHPSLRSSHCSSKTESNSRSN